MKRKKKMTNCNDKEKKYNSSNFGNLKRLRENDCPERESILESPETQNKVQTIQNQPTETISFSNQVIRYLKTISQYSGAAVILTFVSSAIYFVVATYRAVEYSSYYGIPVCYFENYTEFGVFVLLCVSFIGIFFLPFIASKVIVTNGVKGKTVISIIVNAIYLILCFLIFSIFADRTIDEKNSIWRLVATIFCTLAALVFAISIIAMSIIKIKKNEESTVLYFIASITFACNFVVMFSLVFSYAFGVDQTKSYEMIAGEQTRVIVGHYNDFYVTMGCLDDGNNLTIYKDGTFELISMNGQMVIYKTFHDVRCVPNYA